MKRMWQNWLTLVALVTMVGSANAQTNWNQPSAIGSYQSILSRAGYGNASGSAPLQGATFDPGALAQGSASRSGSFAPGGVAQGGNGFIQGGAVQGGNGFIQGGTVQGGSGFVQGGAVQGGIIQGGPTQGSASRGGIIQGDISQGSATRGGIIQGEVSQGSGSRDAGIIQGSIPTISAPPAVGIPPAPGQSAVGSVGSFDTGSNFVGSGVATSAPIYNGVVSGVVAQPAYSAPVYSAPVYSAPVYQSAVYSAPVAVNTGRSRPRRNYTFGITGLNFQRDYEDNRLLARNPSGDTLFTNDADEQNFDGYGVNFASRNQRGGGFEVAYWALNPGRAAATLTGFNVATNIRGFDRLTHVSSGRDLLDIYSNTISQTITRDTDINNLEFNFLRNGGTFHTKRKRTGFYELLAGFRWFQFDESLQYSASIDTNQFPLVPPDFFYNLEARNTLLGFQLGARNELCISPKLRLFSGFKGGLFNNNINTLQNLTDGNGEIAQVNSGLAAGSPFSYEDEKNDLAFLGEIDLGILYHLSNRARIRLGFRALGVSGVALAADQIPFDFSDPDELLRANSNGSLILGGGYYGIEFCF